MKQYAEADGPRLLADCMAKLAARPTKVHDPAAAASGFSSATTATDGGRP